MPLSLRSSHCLRPFGASVQTKEKKRVSNVNASSFVRRFLEDSDASEGGALVNNKQISNLSKYPTRLP